MFSFFKKKPPSLPAKKNPIGRLIFDVYENNDVDIYASWKICQDYNESTKLCRSFAGLIHIIHSGVTLDATKEAVDKFGLSKNCSAMANDIRVIIETLKIDYEDRPVIRPTETFWGQMNEGHRS